MRLLILEDNAIKYSDICKTIKSITAMEISWALNLNDGINMYEKAVKENRPYDCIITDMWYPKTSGGLEANSGELLIDYAHDNNWTTPIILCSSVNYTIPGIKGTVHYAENVDWEERMTFLINRILTAGGKNGNS